MRLRRRRQGQHGRIIGSRLQPGCYVDVTRKNFRTRHPRVAEQSIMPAGLRRLESNRLLIDSVILLGHANDLGEFATEYLGIAVSCQAHNLGGIIGRDPRMRTDVLPQEAE